MCRTDKLKGLWVLAYATLSGVLFFLGMLNYGNSLLFSLVSGLAVFFGAGILAVMTIVAFAKRKEIQHLLSRPNRRYVLGPTLAIMQVLAVMVPIQMATGALS